MVFLQSTMGEFCEVSQNTNPNKKLMIKQLLGIIFTLAVVSTTSKAQKLGDESYGIGSFYADYFYNRPTSTGEILQKNQYTAAHMTLPRYRTSIVVHCSSVIEWRHSRILEYSSKHLMIGFTNFIWNWWHQEDTVQLHCFVAVFAEIGFEVQTLFKWLLSMSVRSYCALASSTYNIAVFKNMYQSLFASYSIVPPPYLPLRYPVWQKVCIPTL